VGAHFDGRGVRHDAANPRANAIDQYVIRRVVAPQSAARFC
jgi:hypothetical protein